MPKLPRLERETSRSQAVRSDPIELEPDMGPDIGVAPILGGYEPLVATVALIRYMAETEIVEILDG